jgi:hypothetical protein
VFLPEDRAAALQSIERWARSLEAIVQPSGRDEIVLAPKSEVGVLWSVRWRDHEGALEIEFASAECLQGDRLREGCAALRFALEAHGVAVEDGPSSGVLLPMDALTPARPLGSLLDGFMAARGLRRVDADPNFGACSITYSRTADGPVEWMVDWREEIASDGSVEAFHVAVPFDGDGESALIEELARALGLRL